MTRLWIFAGACLLIACNPLPDVDLPDRAPGEKITPPPFLPIDQVTLSTATDEARTEAIEADVEARTSELTARAERLREASTE